MNEIAAPPVHARPGAPESSSPPGEMDPVLRILHSAVRAADTRVIALVPGGFAGRDAAPHAAERLAEAASLAGCHAAIVHGEATPRWHQTADGEDEIGRASTLFDLVLVTAPPPPFAFRCAGALLVVAAGRSTEVEVAEAVSACARSGVPLLGALFATTPRP